MSELSRRDFLKAVVGAALAVILAALLGGRGGWTMAADMETTPQGVVNALTGLDTWILVQPKAWHRCRASRSTCPSAKAL